MNLPSVKLPWTSGGVRRLARWRQLVPRIAALEPELQQLSARDLRKRSLSLRYRAKSHEPLNDLLPE
ncbi:MAG TPA: hypothetical protein VHY20_14230, partial [Pirellulales bacterium]|nr:hypothetical protein [Pirellulales bacterium]